MAEMPRPRSMMPAPAPVAAVEASEPPPWGFPPPEGWPAPPPSKRTAARIIHSADQLWELACQYFQHQLDNPIMITKTHQAQQFKVATEAPPTWEGLSIWCGVSRTQLGNYRNERPDLAPVLDRCEAYIHDTIISLGLAGVYNGNLATRYAGISDTVNRNVTVTAKTDRSDDDQRCIYPHPDATPEQLADLTARGVEFPLFSRRQIETRALPVWTMPPEDFSK